VLAPRADRLIKRLAFAPRDAQRIDISGEYVACAIVIG
jgi:hypothetical protein